MKTELSVFFKMMQKDDKKEVLKFEIKGNEDGDAEGDLFSLSGSIVVFSIAGCAAGDVTAEFMNIQRDSKKTVMKFAMKGDSEEKAQQLYRYAGRNVTLTVQPSQMTMDEFYGEDEDEHEGIEYSVDGDGTVSVPQDQLTIDDVDPDGVESEERYEEELPGTGDDGDPMHGLDDESQMPQLTNPEDDLPF